MQLVQYNYLMKLRDHVPKNVLDKSWLQPPSILEEVSVAAGFGRGGDGFCSVVTGVHTSCRKRAVISCWLVLCSGMMSRTFGRPWDPLYLGEDKNERNGAVFKSPV